MQQYGKNQFNSCFPISLLTWMADRDIPAVLVCGTQSGTEECVELARVHLREILTLPPTGQAYWDFEKPFPPFGPYFEDGPSHLDAVLLTREGGAALHTLEIKLTVVPDSTTKTREQAEWRPEIVVRPTVVAHIATSLFHRASDNLRTEIARRIRALDIRSWGNRVELLASRDQLLTIACALLDGSLQGQFPILLNSLWFTNGQSPEIIDPGFDSVIWTDSAWLRVLIEKASTDSVTVTRHDRALWQVLRMFSQMSNLGSAQITQILDEMTFDLQSDKSFSISGSGLRNIIPDNQWSDLNIPLVARQCLTEILQGGPEALSPERRLDQSLYFATRNEHTD